MLVIYVDTDSDVTPKIAAEYGFKLISMPYTINGVDYYPYKDANYVFEDKKFYDTLRSGILPSTSALNPQDYIEYFKPDFEAGNDIFYIHFSEAMSGTFNSMRLAVNDLKKEYPDRKFYELDTKSITIESLAIILEIGELLKQGKDVEFIINWAKTEVSHYATYFYAEDLKFFHKSGRVNGLTAVMGNLLKICPIIYMDENGTMTSIGKERGPKKSLARLLQYVSELGDDIKSHKIIIGHCDMPDAANQIAEMLKSTYGEDLDIMFCPVNPTAGSHCGPNTLGVTFHSIHR